MKQSNNFGGVVGVAFCGLLLESMNGCTTYVEQPSARVAYAPPPEVYSAPRVYSRPPAVFVPPPPSYSEPVLTIRSETDFYEPLTPYGQWEVVENHGRCWIPSRVAADWHPYSDGYWQRTEAGWYWASDEPWAWATYHYGRWDLHPQFGWYWVPQIQWAPAWVSWRHGGGYVGWAPLHPFQRIGFTGTVDVNAGFIAPRAFVFVEERRFLEPIRPATVVVNNTTIINNTVNITNIKVVNNNVVNEGPRPSVIEQASGQKVQAVPVRELRRKQEESVVANQRITTPSAVENPIRSPARTEVPPRVTRASPAAEPRPTERPAVSAPAPVAPARLRQPLEQTRVNTPPVAARPTAVFRPVVPAVTPPTVAHETRPTVAHETLPTIPTPTQPAGTHGGEMLLKKRPNMIRRPTATNSVNAVQRRITPELQSPLERPVAPRPQ